MSNKQTTTNQTVNDRAHKFDHGSVLSVLLKTALPIVILMLFNTAYSFIDSLMSSNFVEYGETIKENGEVVALNGGTSIGLIFPLMGILTAFEVMIAVGAGLAYTQSMAQKDYNAARQRHNEATTMIILSCVIVFVIIALIGIPYLKTVSGNWHNKVWGDHTNKMIMDGYGYMLVLGVSFIPMQLNTSYIRVLRAEGKGDVAALFPILTFPVNIFFDWLFMSHIKLGLVGAGIATLIASMFGLFIILVYVWYNGHKDKINIKLKLPAFKIHKEIAIIILTFAMGSLLRRLFDNGTVIVLSNYIGNMNVDGSNVNDLPQWTGAWTVMTRSINMGSMLSLGVAQSMSMLISYYVGSKQKEKIGDTIKFGAISMIVCTIFATLVLFGLQGVLFNAYSETSYGWKWGNDLFYAFLLALLYSIPLGLQPLAVMFYSGCKMPKATLIHSLSFNAIVILFSTLGLMLDLQTGQPLYIYGSLFVGALIGLIVVSILFKYRYKELITNNI